MLKSDIFLNSLQLKALRHTFEVHKKVPMSRRRIHYEDYHTHEDSRTSMVGTCVVLGIIILLIALLYEAFTTYLLPYLS
jgi:hypothetical protein